MKLFALKNDIAGKGFFNRPMYFESSEECINALQNNVASDSTKALFSMAEHMFLYYVGDIDFTTCVISQPKKPILIGCVADFLKDINFKEVIIKDENSNKCS